MKPSRWHALGLATPILTVQCGQIPAPQGKLGVTVPTLEDDLFGVLLASDPTVSNLKRAPNQLRGVVEDSGICETTSGVHQASGYADISADGSIWFWFFAARNNPDTAPLTLWFNGGPGSSSMVGLTQEHGPCRISNDSDTVTLNPYSWNQRSNILYIDQPVGVGFSTGTRVVGSSSDAARDIWTFMQIWLSDSRFSQYQDRDLGIWTESYGGHYGSAFAFHFLSQNADIAAGRTSGITLNLKSLGIGNGLTAPLPQYQGIIDYAFNNTYRQFDSNALSLSNDAWTRQGGCRDRIIGCEHNGTDQMCSDAQNFCNRDLYGPLSKGINVYYTPNPSTDPYPRDPTVYLNSIRSTIGADVTWTMSNTSVYFNFAATGDWMRDSSPILEKVIDSGVRTLIYDGDADFSLNYKGVELMLDALNSTFSEEYRQQTFQNWLVAGQVTGLYKNARTLSYVRIFGAGHEVPAYGYGSLNPGQAALQMFTQIVTNQSISSDDSSGNSAQGIHLNLPLMAGILMAFLVTWTL